MLLHRILFGGLLMLGLAGCALTRFLDMTLLSSVDYTELGAQHITDERRQQLVAGLRNLGTIQFRTNVYAWWAALATTVVATIGLMNTFRKPKP